MTNINDAIGAIKSLTNLGKLTQENHDYIMAGIETHLREDDEKEQQKAIELKKPVFKIFLQRTYETRTSVRDHVRMEIIASNETEALEKARDIEPVVGSGFFKYTVVTVQELRDE